VNGDIIAIPPDQVRGTLFQKRRSSNPVGRRPGSRNKATIAAAKLLAGELEGLTRRAVELALAGDPIVLRLCVERILPVSRERAVNVRLPPIKSSADIAPAMEAVISALAKGAITPGEAGRIAAVVDTFVRAIETSEFELRLKVLEDSFKARDAAPIRGAGSAWPYNR
jgi:hypothetical protein